jgi:hypothetical protein
MSIQAVTGSKQAIRLSPGGWRWLAIALVAIIDAALLASTGTSLSGTFLMSYGEALGTWGALTLLYGLLGHNPRLAAMTEIVMQASLFSVLSAVFSYLVLAFRAPLMDAQFTALDAMLGLDWMGWFHWVDGHRSLRSLLILAYDSLPLQIGVCILFLPWMGRQRYLSELLSAAIAALLVIIPVWAFLPALGSWVQFGVGVAEAEWLPDVLAMRAGTMPVLGEHAFHGVIVLPSFHTVLAMLLVHAMRWNPLALTVSAVLNALVLLSVPSVGSHYFVDVIAGVPVGLLAIAVARRIESSGAP